MSKPALPSVQWGTWDKLTHFCEPYHSPVLFFTSQAPIACQTLFWALGTLHTDKGESCPLSTGILSLPAVPTLSGLRYYVSSKGLLSGLPCPFLPPPPSSMPCTVTTGTYYILLPPECPTLFKRQAWSCLTSYCSPPPRRPGYPDQLILSSVFQAWGALLQGLPWIFLWLRIGSPPPVNLLSSWGFCPLYTSSLRCKPQSHRNLSQFFPHDSPEPDTQ